MLKRGSSTELLESPIPLGLPLELRRTPRARRLSLKVDQARGRIVLVAPHSVARRRALDFLVRHAGWLEARIAEIPAAIPFSDGATIPLLGIPHIVQGDFSTLRGRASHADGIITVPGAPEHLSRRLSEYLKAEARREIAARARAKAAGIEARITAIALRDTSTRWGSCNRAGRLGFSWRLILAPEFVLDYVVAHEVAHLVELNHGPRFWKLCASLTEGDPDKARAWLTRHGSTLHRYG